jgi:hypothetical protein
LWPLIKTLLELELTCENVTVLHYVSHISGLLLQHGGQQNDDDILEERS